ncbi:MAG: hypothetical protein R2867_03565 [Caldilineaceae bacterium]
MAPALRRHIIDFDQIQLRRDPIPATNGVELIAQPRRAQSPPRSHWREFMG